MLLPMFFYVATTAFACVLESTRFRVRTNRFETGVKSGVSHADRLPLCGRGVAHILRAVDSSQLA